MQARPETAARLYSVENIGIILIAWTPMIFTSFDMSLLALSALIAGLFTP